MGDATEELDGRSHRPWHVGSKEGAEIGQPEAAVLLLGEDAGGDQQAEDTPQRWRVRLGRFGERLGSSGALGEVVGDAEPRGDVDGL